MNKLHALIVVNPLDSLTANLAIEIADDLDGDLMLIQGAEPCNAIERKLIRSMHAVLNVPMRMLPFSYDPYLYDVAIVGTSVWNGLMAPEVKTFLNRTKDRLPNLALFATHSGLGAEAALDHMELLAETTALARCSFSHREFGTPSHQLKVDQFERNIVRRAGIINALGAACQIQTW